MSDNSMDPKKVPLKQKLDNVTKSKPVQQLFKNKTTFFKVGIVAAGLAVGIGLLWGAGRIGTLLLKSTCSAVLSDDVTSRFGQRTKPVVVEAALVTPGTIAKRIQSIGQLKPNNIVTLRAEIHGRVREIPAIEGGDVKKGDLLVQFDDLDAKAEFAEATANLELKDANLRRMTALKGIESTKKLDEAKAERDVAFARLEKAKSNLAKTTIVAPFDGTMGLIEPSPGAYVQANHEIGTLVDNNPMKVEFKIPERNLHEVGVGQAVEIRLDGFRDQVFLATVEAIDSKVDMQSHSVAVRATIPNADGHLRGGFFANVHLVVGEKGDALLVPESALGRDGEIEYVWTVKRGKVGYRKVLTSTRENGNVEIVSGLLPGEIVVTSGQMRLAVNGQRVKMLNLNDDGTPRTQEEQKAIKEEEGLEDAEEPSAQPKKNEKKDTPSDKSSASDTKK